MAWNGFGIGFLERALFQFGGHLVHADPARERRVDIERFVRDAPAAFRLRDEPQRAHVVQAIGQLHEQNAHVLGGREQEFLQVRRLLVLSGESSSKESLVTPSTSSATCSPNCLAICSFVATVSSIVSCSRPAMIVAVSSLYSVRMPATSIGWAK